MEKINQNADTKKNSENVAKTVSIKNVKNTNISTKNIVKVENVVENKGNEKKDMSKKYIIGQYEFLPIEFFTVSVPISQNDTSIKNDVLNFFGKFSDAKIMRRYVTEFKKEQVVIRLVLKRGINARSTYINVMFNKEKFVEDMKKFLLKMEEDFSEVKNNNSGIKR